MKKLQIIVVLLLICNLPANAQVSVNINLGKPPVWAPAQAVETQYYYLPDIDAYYDVPAARFIYVKNGNWIRSTNLPYQYRNYNLKKGKVVYLTDYRGKSPYVFYKNHKIKYAKNMKYEKTDYKDHDDHKDDDHKKDNGKGKGHGKKH